MSREAYCGEPVPGEGQNLCTLPPGHPANVPHRCKGVDVAEEVGRAHLYDREAQARRAVRDSQIDEAVSILAHYFTNAPIRGGSSQSDMRAELRTAVERIVDAAKTEVDVRITSVKPATQLKPGERDDRD